jgi:histidinol-phosphate aminotransferase
VSEPAPQPHILSLARYELAELPPPGLKRVIHLSQNENASPPSPVAIEAAKTALAEANRYPHGDAGPLRHAIGAAEKLSAERIVCAAGSMELLSLLSHAYLGPGDEVVVSEHGYLFFRTVARQSGAGVAVAPERDLAMDVDAILDRVGPRTRMVLLANPNNPTGSMLSGSEIRRLSNALREDIMLVLDGAYADYVGEPDFENGAALVDATANTVMIRTFSKIHGLAGLRVGWGYFPAAIAEIVNRIRQPNGVTQPGMAAAMVAIADRARMAAQRETTAENRAWFVGAIAANRLRAYPSHGNFVLIRFADAADAADAYRFLKGEGIFLRPMSAYGLGDCLRATIGTIEEMRASAAALKAWADAR